MNYKWNYEQPSPEQSTQHAQLAEELGIHPVLGKLLHDRGITSAAEARRFFRPQLPDLHDPFLMNDMRKAVERLNRAMGRKERIMVYGDYDVDGCTAVALVYKFLQNFYSNVDFYIPDRYEEGYGISCKGIDFAAETGVGLIIVLDCGIKAVEEIAYAKERGVDFIICDHHVPDEELPPAAAILNPKRKDNTYPNTDLSGCGVGFKFMQAFALSNGIEFSKLIPLLDLCAISIASDIVPIMGENRILASHGIRCLNTNPSIGLQAIIEVCGLSGKELSMADIVFKIGPRINASGRMQSGKEAVDLLVAKDMTEAIEKSQNIDQYNEDRKELDKRITEEASQILAEHIDIEQRRSIVIYNKDWHKGIIGIVASRLTELYYRPAVVLTLCDGLATGSARSVQGFDIYKAVESCRDLLENFGGHTYAVGLSMKEEHIKEFTRRFEEHVTEHILPTQMEPQIDIDTEIDFSEITPEFFAMLKQFNPFGPGNQKPVFITRNVGDYGTSRLVGRKNEHVKLELVDSRSKNIMNGIAFNMSQHFEHIKADKPFDICYTIEENTHNNGAIQLFIKDIHPTE